MSELGDAPESSEHSNTRQIEPSIGALVLGAFIGFVAALVRPRSWK